MKKLFLLCACFLYATTAFSDVKTTGFTPGLLRLEISGSITQADYRRFTQLEEEVFPSIQKTTGKPVAFFVDLNSTGGDIRAAMGIGRILRNHIALAKVLGGSTCQSACVLVLAGAPSRAVWGTIGIHRPYDPRATATSAAEQKTL